MRRTVSFMLIIAIAVSLAGCSESWRRKFIRQKKETKKPRIYQLKRYKKEPNEALYDKHFNYCVTWLSELAEDIGKNSKKDARCIQEAISQMKDMQAILVPEKGSQLDKHIKRLKEAQSTILKGDLDQANLDYVRRNVEREERFIRAEFYYNKIKNYMIKSFDEEEEQLKPVEVATQGPVLKTVAAEPKGE